MDAISDELSAPTSKYTKMSSIFEFFKRLPDTLIQILVPGFMVVLPPPACTRSELIPTVSECVFSDSKSSSLTLLFYPSEVIHSLKLVLILSPKFGTGSMYSQIRGLTVDSEYLFMHSRVYLESTASI